MGHTNIDPHSEPSAVTMEDEAAGHGGASNPDHAPNPSVKKPAKSDTADLEINSNGNPYLSYASVKTECKRALNALRRGNHTKALRLMKDLCSENENYPQLALVHRVQGAVLVKMASIIDDPNAKYRHLINAIESARRAVSLSPNSIEFAHFYANLLYEDAKYKEVVRECERALMIEKPVDLAEESLLQENMGNEVFSTAEARLAHFQSELRSLIQQSNIASISIWMKKMGNEIMGRKTLRYPQLRRTTTKKESKLILGKL